MPQTGYNLAIETASRPGSVSLGQGDQLIDTLTLYHPGPGRQPPIELMVAIDRLTQAHNMAPTQLAEIYLSIGPGSFTGLRIAVATAKSLAYAVGLRLVAVPTIQAVAHNVPTPTHQDPDQPQHLAVCLNTKHDSVYAGVLTCRDGQWQAQQPPSVCTMQALLESVPRPVMVVGHPLPKIPEHLAHDVELLPPELTVGRSDVVWRLGRQLAQARSYADPFKLLPLYARPPEAQTLWKKHRKNKTPHPKQTHQPCAVEGIPS